MFIVSKQDDDFIVIQNIPVHIEFWQDLRHYCLPWGHWSTVATAYKKVTMITSTHILTLSSLRWKGLHFLLSWINKLNHNFFYWQFFFTCLPPEKPCDIAFIPSVLERVQRWQVSWIMAIVELKKQKKNKKKTATPSWHSPFKYSCWWSRH